MIIRRVKGFYQIDEEINFESRIEIVIKIIDNVVSVSKKPAL